MGSGAVQRDGLGDGHGAITGRIEAVDLSAGHGLGDRACKGLARRGAAARVRVVADTGYPGSGGLRLDGRSIEDEGEQYCE